MQDEGSGRQLPQRTSPSEEFGSEISRLSADTLALLDSLSRIPEVKNIWYNNKLVVLDGYKFIGCRFDKCRLEISSMNFEIHRCLIDENTVIQFGANAMKIIRLFNSRHQPAYALYPQFAPVKHEDGTITVAGKTT